MRSKMALKLNKKAIEKIKVEKEKQYTILIVDDEKTNLRALRKVLQDDYEIMEANDGKTALDLIHHQPTPSIHLIITDQRMPKLSGVEFLEYSIPILPQALRIILTGYTDINDIIDSINKGQIYKFITKPFDPHQLKLTVKRAIEAYELQIQNKRLVEELQETVGKLQLEIEKREKLEIEKKLQEEIIIQKTKIVEQAKELEKKNQEIEYTARHDFLTALPNRAYFNDFVESRIQTPNDKFALLFLDLDSFKPINDKHGHKIGDEVLIIVSRRISKIIKEKDMVFRFGGDEFVIILDGIENAEVAKKIGYKILENLKLPMECKGLHLNIEASIGISLFPIHGSDEDSILVAADNAMYEAKRSGKNKVYISE